MALVFVFAYALTHIVHFAGIIAEYIQIKYPDTRILGLYGPFLIAFQAYALFKNCVFFITEFSGPPTYYLYPNILAIETLLHSLFIFLFVRLVSRIIPVPPRLWHPRIARAIAIAPLVPAILLPWIPSLVAHLRLFSILCTSAILFYSALYFLAYYREVQEPACAKPMMFFTAVCNLAFIPLFIGTQLLKNAFPALPWYLFPENLYLLALGLVNIVYDTPLTLFSHKKSAPDEITELTEKEKLILMLIQEGLGNKQIAVKMDLGETTVRNYIHALFKRFNVKNRVQLLGVLQRLPRT